MSRTRHSPPTEGEEGSIFRIPPYYYLHVFDQTTNITKVELGPKTFIRQDNEKVSLTKPSKFVVLSHSLLPLTFPCKHKGQCFVLLQ